MATRESRFVTIFIPMIWSTRFIISLKIRAAAKSITWAAAAIPIVLCEKISGRKINYEYVDKNRIGDHIWWISDVSKFKAHYPAWNYKYGLEGVIKEIYEAQH